MRITTASGRGGRCGSPDDQHAGVVEIEHQPFHHTGRASLSDRPSCRVLGASGRTRWKMPRPRRQTKSTRPLLHTGERHGTTISGALRRRRVIRKRDAAARSSNWPIKFAPTACANDCGAEPHRSQTPTPPQIRAQRGEERPPIRRHVAHEHQTNDRRRRAWEEDVPEQVRGKERREIPWHSGHRAECQENRQTEDHEPPGTIGNRGLELRGEDVIGPSRRGEQILRLRAREQTREEDDPGREDQHRAQGEEHEVEERLRDGAFPRNIVHRELIEEIESHAEGEDRDERARRDHRDEPRAAVPGRRGWKRNSDVRSRRKTRPGRPRVDGCRS